VAVAVSVLHVIEYLDRGAVENWLLRMLEYASKQKVPLDWTFYCTVGKPGTLDDRVRSAGGKIVYSPYSLSQKARFLLALRREIRSGNYSVIHCHHDIMNTVYLAASLGLPVSRRIAHVHNADETLPTPNSIKQYLLREPMRWLCLTLADRVVGISNHTLDTFLSGRSRTRGKDLVHYYGIDQRRFLNLQDQRIKFRRENGWSDNALILLFGGRLVPEKNPVFVVDVLAELRRIEPNAIAVFVGSGSCKSSIDARARELGVDEAVSTLGWRTDLPEIMAASDCFILPRPEKPMEGFGMAVVEAQLAGLAMLLSCGIPDDPLLPTAKYRRLSLKESAQAWARAAVELLRSERAPKEEIHLAFSRSPMEMNYALFDLLRLYE
jgi:glycosyltransferase involved in cell wall biosynthesis